MVAYHLTGRPSGGYLGVDVFFVISGFLITSHLLKSPPSSLRGFGAFWARRIVRLLPPAFVVIAATTVAVLVLFPSSQWRALAREALTSMLYVQNWQLISVATDYLDAGRAPSPFQHFWSLSVEEQYYLFWPFVVALVALAHRARGWDYRRCATAVFAVLLVASLAWSVYRTVTRPEVAYFSTLTRLWELAIGSLLAAAVPFLTARLSIAARLALLWTGALGIVWSCLVFTPQSAIPGYAALVPTVATAMVILANDPGSAVNPRWLTHSRPVQFIGDASYAIYLWHWPIVIVAPHVIGRPMGWFDRGGLLVLTLLLSWLSTRFLEYRVRSLPILRTRLRHAYGLGLALSLAVLAASTAVNAYVDRVVGRDQAAVASALSESCVGAGALENPQTCRLRGKKLITTPAFAREDVTEGIRDCLNWPPFEDRPISCARGNTDNPTAKIALFGNSHAGQWTEALTDIADERGWRLDTYIMGACFTAIEQPTTECDDIVGQAIRMIYEGDYDLVVMATYDDAGSTRGIDMYTDTIDSFVAQDANVLVLRDTPAPWDEANPPVDCVAQNPGNLAACDGPREWIRPDPLHHAATLSTSSRVFTGDYTRYFCTDRGCPSVIGGVIVLCDYNHVSVTYSRTLVPYLGADVDRAMAIS